MAKDPINDEIEDEEELDDTELDDELEDDESEDEPEDEEESDEPEKKPKMVKLSRHLKVVNRLKAQLAARGTKPSATEIADLAEKHNVDAAFVEDVIKTVKAELKPDIDKIEQSQKAKDVQQAFTTEFERIVEERPDLKTKKDVLWNLSQTPKYRKMSLDDIADDVFGQKPGKDSSEEDTPASGGDEGGMDFARMTEAEIREKVLPFPAKRQKYYDHLADKGE